MTATIPLQEPAKLIIGDTAKWRVYEADYLPGTWTISYAMVSPDARIAITGSDNGDNTHLITETAANTASWLPGEYFYQVYATSGAERFMLREGYLEIKENFATLAAGFDARSHTKIVLDALEAMSEGKASQDQMGYSIGGRSLQRMSPADITTWLAEYRQRWKRELAEMRASRDLASGRKVKARFN